MKLKKLVLWFKNGVCVVYDQRSNNILCSYIKLDMANIIQCSRPEKSLISKLKQNINKTSEGTCCAKTIKVI